MFDENRYFDVFVEYAKADAEDILIRITVANRGPEAANLHAAADDLVPQHLVVGRPRPPAGAATRRDRSQSGNRAESRSAGQPLAALRRLSGTAVHRKRNQCAAAVRSGKPTPYVKDGINDYVVHGAKDSRESGPGSAPRPRLITNLTSGPEKRVTVRLRLANSDFKSGRLHSKASIRSSRSRQREADEFYATVIPRRSLRRMRKM